MGLADSDASYLFDMSNEALTHAETEDRLERTAKQEREREAARQRMVGAVRGTAGDEEEENKAARALRTSDRSYLVDMSTEAQHHAETEKREEHAARQEAARAEQRQRRVGSEMEVRRGEQGGVREGRQEEESADAGKYVRRIEEMKRTYTSEIAAEKKKLAAARLQLKQQEEMAK